MRRTEVLSEKQAGEGQDARPLVRWAGSKKRDIQSLLQHFPESFSRYIEPFCGSACVFFKLQPNDAVLSDLNSELIHFYVCGSSHAEELYRRMMRFPRTSEFYYSLRHTFQTIDDSIERAASFYYLNRNCYNGIYRTNRAGQFNVPFSSSRVPSYPDQDSFLTSFASLSRAKVLNGDFEDVCLDSIQRGDLFYLDPPYFSTGQRIFREYQSPPFGQDDLSRLARMLCRIAEGGAKFVLSYPPTPEALDIASGWKVERVRMRRSISAKTLGRGWVDELVIKNF